MSQKLEREALRRKRALERERKEALKRSELQQAAEEVSEFESRVEVLLTLHHEPIQKTDWRAVACQLCPPPWSDVTYHEWRAVQRGLLAKANKHSEWERDLEDAKTNDRIVNEVGRKNADAAVAEWRRRTALAQRIRAGDTQAYAESLRDYSPLNEMTNLGSTIDFRMHSPSLVECLLTVNGTQVIPSETKSLTSTGKISIKAMPRGRFHEIYQDYVCGCVLRLACEVAALLPVETVLVTASIPSQGEATGTPKEIPVLSVIIPVSKLNQLNLPGSDASDTLERFTHRGDFKATRKVGAFQPITPYSEEDLPKPSAAMIDLERLRTRVAKLRNSLRAGLS